MTTDQEKIAITKYDLLYEQRMTRTETQSENTIKAISEITSTLKEIKSEMKSDFHWLLGIMISGLGIILGANAGMFAVMAHGFKWF
jgi:hypothetical protein